MNSIGVVIVTYNRLEKLKKALCAYEEQSVKPVYILVVDNNSTDGTSDFLADWKKQGSCISRQVLSLCENTGGSGGFFAGIEAAQNMGSPWIWVGDDDAYPDKFCFQYLDEYINTHDMGTVSALCASVYTNEKIDTWHRRQFIRRFGLVLDEKRIDAAEYKKEKFLLDLFSYVGTLLKTETVKKVGLPEKNFFIAYDDSEHSIRMRKQGEILCLPEAKVVHDTSDTEDKKLTWKKYYALRNKVYSYRKHFGALQAFIQRSYFLMKNRTDKALFQMTKKALNDAKEKRLGLDTVYKPGWKADQFE